VFYNGYVAKKKPIEWE